MSMSIYIMTLQHVWYIWQVCEVTVFSYTVVVVEIRQTGKKNGSVFVFFFCFFCCCVDSEWAASLLGLLLLRRLSSGCVNHWLQIYTQTQEEEEKKKRHLTKHGHSGVLAPSFAFYFTCSCCCSPTLPSNFPDSDWWSTVLYLSLFTCGHRKRLVDGFSSKHFAKDV